MFLRDGLRGATMEAIARQAGVAKATLYGYFPDKEAVFGAVAERLATMLTETVERELSREGTATQRIAGAIAAKHRAVFRLLEGSPHARELYEAGSPKNSERVAAFDRWVEAEIVRILKEEGHAEPVRLAQLISACGEGIALRARYAEEIGPAIRLVADRLLAAPAA